MFKIKYILVAATMFLAATLTSSLLAQTPKQYYSTVEIEGEDTILYIRGYDDKPALSDKVIFVCEQELTDRPEYNLIDMGNSGSNPLLEQIKRAKLEVDENFKPKKTKFWFWQFSALEEIEGLENLNTEEVTTMWGMFASCESLKSLDLSSFKTDKVTSLWSMFSECYSLEVVDFGSLKTDKVNNIGYTFSKNNALKYIFCDTDANITISANPNNFFVGCTNLAGVKTDGSRNECSGNNDDATENDFKKADEGGFFTVKSSDKIVLLAPEKTKYTLGEDLDLNGGYIAKRIFFGEGEHYDMELCALDRLTVDGFDNTQTGEQELSVEYKGKSYSFKVDVEAKPELKEVSVVSEPSLKEYKMPVTAEALNLSGGVINKVYTNDSTVEYAMDTLVFTVSSGLEAIAVGENTLVLSFDLGDTTFEWEYVINVLEAATEDSTGSGEEPGSGDEPGSGEEPGEGGDDPIVAVEDLNACGGSAFEVWTSGGVLSAKVERGGVLEVVSLSGVLVRRVEVMAGSSLNLPLEKGVYVLRIGDEVKKVVVE